MSIIQLTQAARVYGRGQTRVEALKGIDLNVSEGEFVGIMGPSGSGKSTLLALFGGLTAPSSGEVRVDGVDLGSLPDGRLADFRRIYLGFVFQAFNLVPYLTALENVLLPLAVANGPARSKRERAREALERVGLGGRLHHLPGQLSGGEQERVAIARALVNRPSLLLADEPTGNLDSATSHQVMELLAELNREGLTVVMVTHNEENRRYFSRILALRDGRIDNEERSAARTAA